MGQTRVRWGNHVNIFVNNSEGQKMEPTVERWRTVSGFEGYMVSDLGRVKAVERKCRHVSKSRTESYATRKEKTLTACMDGAGYLHVRLSAGGRQTLWKVHQLVAKEFLRIRQEQVPQKGLRLPRGQPH